MIQRLIIEEGPRGASESRAEVRSCYVSLQKEMDGMRVWARLEYAEVVDLSRILIHSFTDLEYSDHYSYMQTLKEVGPTAEMKAWSTITPISPQTRWYVEIVIPN